MSEEMPESRFQIETEARWADREDEARRDNTALDEAQRTIAEIKGTEGSLEGNRLSFEDAEKLFGNDFLGPQAVEQVFGTKPETIPNIPFSKEELERAKELGQQLIYQIDVMDVKDPETDTIERGISITPANLKKYFPTAHDGSKIFDDPDGLIDGYSELREEMLRTGWRLTSKDIIPNSTSKNYFEQTDVLIGYLQNEVFKGAKLPKHYEDAITEFEREQPKIKSLMKSDWQKASQALVELAITKLTRELLVEVMYRLRLNDQVRKDKPLPSTATWTASAAGVYIGGFDDTGASIYGDSFNAHRDFLGVSFSRS